MVLCPFDPSEVGLDWKDPLAAFPNPSDPLAVASRYPVDRTDSVEARDPDPSAPCSLEVACGLPCLIGIYRHCGRVTTDQIAEAADPYAVENPDAYEVGKVDDRMALHPELEVVPH